MEVYLFFCILSDDRKDESYRPTSGYSCRVSGRPHSYSGSSCNRSLLLYRVGCLYLLYFFCCLCIRSHAAAMTLRALQISTQCRTCNNVVLTSQQHCSDVETTLLRLSFTRLVCDSLGSVVQNLTKLLANVTLKFLSWNIAKTLVFFCWKNVSSFYIAKGNQIFV